MADRMPTRLVSVGGRSASRTPTRPSRPCRRRRRSRRWRTPPRAEQVGRASPVQAAQQVWHRPRSDERRSRSTTSTSLSSSRRSPPPPLLLRPRLAWRRRGRRAVPRPPPLRVGPWHVRSAPTAPPTVCPAISPRSPAWCSPRPRRGRRCPPAWAAPHRHHQVAALGAVPRQLGLLLGCSTTDWCCPGRASAASRSGRRPARAAATCPAGSAAAGALLGRTWWKSQALRTERLIRWRSSSPCPAPPSPPASRRR
mmetsp:Transcript_26962/g.77202  ORF Transcript_26962/g.77202 Transcript_26962/m.77202 type:complete len:254 (-) Transcript_26962:220-981(-)